MLRILKDLKEVVKAVKQGVINNLDSAKIKTGTKNPFGDQTLLLDQSAEDTAISILQSSNTDYAILTEEQGFVKAEKKPEYLAILDPIDGSANLERGIPLCSVGVSAIPYSDEITTDDVEISIIDSFFTNETYVAQKDKGVTLNGEEINTGMEIDSSKAIISYDTKKPLNGEFGNKTLRILGSIHDMRRSASNLLDLCWTASGALDAMVDLRGVLPIVHVSGTHMVSEAGGYVLDESGSRFCQTFEMNKRMSFVAASTEDFARYLLKHFKD